MSYSQTQTKSKSGYKAGVQDYKLTYYTPDYTPKDTDVLAAFRMSPQPGVPPEEAGAAVAAESSTGTWTTVWTDLLTDLDAMKSNPFPVKITNISATLPILWICLKKVPLPTY